MNSLSVSEPKALSDLGCTDEIIGIDLPTHRSLQS
jgi:hypothetical protein